MSRIDGLLRRLSEEAAPGALASIEDDVLARVRGHRFDREPFGLRVAAVGFALLLGVAGGMLPQGHAHPSERVVPFGEAAHLAPSTLLVSGR